MAQLLLQRLRCMCSVLHRSQSLKNCAALLRAPLAADNLMQDVALRSQAAWVPFAGIHVITMH